MKKVGVILKNIIVFILVNLICVTLVAHTILNSTEKLISEE